MKPLDPKLLKVAAPARGYVILTAVFGVATAALIIVQALALAGILTPIIRDGLGLSAVTTPLAALAAAMLGRALVAGLSERFAHRAATNVIADLRRQVLAKAVALGPRWLSTPTESGSRGTDITTLTTRGVEDLGPYFVRYLPQLLLTLTVTPLTLAVVLGQDLISAIIITVTIPLVPVFMILVGQLTQKTSEKRLTVMSRLGSQVLDLISGLPTLRAFGREIGPAKRVKELGQAYTASTMKTLQVAFLSGMVLELLTTLSVALVAVGIGLRLVYGYTDLYTALVVLILAPEVYLPIRNIGTHFHASTNGIAAFNKVLEVLDAPAPSTNTASTSAPDLATATLHVRGLCIAAPGRDLLAPADLSLTVPPGTITALVGASGGGKSSTVLALLGLAEPTAGKVEWEANGMRYPVSELEPRSLWDQIAWLSQRSTLPPGTLRAALLGTESTQQPERSRNQLLEHAIEQAGLTDLITELPHGLDTVIGLGGLGLSVGQRQRVALAKALLDPKPLGILDEPTAHLDALTESHVLAAITELKDAGSTVIVVAHRPAVVALADQVVTVSSRAIPAEPVAFTGLAPSPVEGETRND